MVAVDFGSISGTDLKTQPMPIFRNAFNNMAYITMEPSSDVGDDEASNNYMTDADMDARIYQAYFGVSLDSLRNSSVMQELFANIQSSRPPAVHEWIFLAISVLGLVLNGALLIAQLRLNRKSWRMRNQRVLIAILSAAHALFCFVHIAEFAILLIGAGGGWTGCLQLFKKRTVKSFCNLLVIGSITGCAVDNYLAVCRPMFHRFQSTRLIGIFVGVIVAYFAASTCLSFSDFIFPFTTDSNCTRTVELASGNAGRASTSVDAGLFSFFELSSTDDFKSYCQFIDDCRSHTPAIELAIIVVWAIAAGVVSFSYISVVIVLRNSLTNVFELPIDTTPRSSRRFSLLVPIRALSQRRPRSESVLGRNASNEITRNLLGKGSSSASWTCKVAADRQLPVVLDDEEEDSNHSPPPSAKDRLTFATDNNPQDVNADSPEPISKNSSAPQLIAKLSVRFSVSTHRASTTEMSSVEDSPAMEMTRRRTVSRRRSSVSQLQQLTLLRNRRRSSYALLIILAVFIVTWLPFVSFQIANEFFFTESFRLNVMRDFLSMFAFLDPLQLLNSVIDPIIYSLTYGEMRRWLSRWFCAGKAKKRRVTINN